VSLDDWFVDCNSTNDHVRRVCDGNSVDLYIDLGVSTALVKRMTYGAILVGHGRTLAVAIHWDTMLDASSKGFALLLFHLSSCVHVVWTLSACYSCVI
jgi:hypothetical protein